MFVEHKIINTHKYTIFSLLQPLILYHYFIKTTEIYSILIINALKHP